MNIEYNTDYLKKICVNDIRARAEFGETTQRKLYVLMKLFEQLPSLSYIYKAYNNKQGKRHSFTQIFIAGKKMLSLYLDISYNIILVPIKSNGEVWADMDFPAELGKVESIKIMEVRKND